MKLVPLPAFDDNYIWMLHDGQKAIVVDPGDASPVIEAIRGLGLALTAILVTHHHPDHIGGLKALAPFLKGPVYGPRDEPIASVTHPVAEGDRLEVEGVRFVVMDVPGHTKGHICYLAEEGSGGDDPDPLLFCGDTLFSGGCGRLLGGQASELFDSLSRLARLPGSTRVCPAHEYTLSNLRFAQTVEPHNVALSRYQTACVALRSAHRPTLPTLIEVERQINPFLRCTEPEVVASALQHGAPNTAPLAVFTELRQWKNHF